MDNKKTAEYLRNIADKIEKNEYEFIKLTQTNDLADDPLHSFHSLYSPEKYCTGFTLTVDFRRKALKEFIDKKYRG